MPRWREAVSKRVFRKEPAFNLNPRAANPEGRLVAVHAAHVSGVASAIKARRPGPSALLGLQGKGAWIWAPPPPTPPPSQRYQP